MRSSRVLLTLVACMLTGCEHPRPAIRQCSRVLRRRTLAPRRKRLYKGRRFRSPTSGVSKVAARRP